MICSRCGKSIPDSALRCPYCGKKTGNYLPEKMDETKRKVKKGFRKILFGK